MIWSESLTQRTNVSRVSLKSSIWIKMKKGEYKMKTAKFKEYIIITLGIILVALSVEYFFAPNNIAAGGVTGAGIIINAIIPNLSVGIITLILNVARLGCYVCRKIKINHGKPW